MNENHIRQSAAYQATLGFISSWTPDPNLARQQADTIYGLGKEETAISAAA